jgi:DNA-binding response OmpR family regulator
VLTRTDLLGHVWDSSFESDSNLIEVYVLSLRSKIDRPFGRASLQTVRGVGYTITDDRAPD